MANYDTIELLKECATGVKTGVTSLNELIPRAKSPALGQALKTSVTEHRQLESEAVRALKGQVDNAGEPSIIARSMSWLKTETMMAFDNSDSSVANLVTDGCNMGIKSLNQSLNDYPQAEATAKTLASKIITNEQSLMEAVKSYL